MGLIPRPFIDGLLSQTDIVALIDSYAPLKKQGTSYVTCCPFHQEKTPSFNVIPKKQFYHCFGCGASGNAISFVMQFLNQNFSEAVETLAARIGMSVPRDGETSVKKFNGDTYQLLEQVNQFYRRMLQTRGELASAYLKDRGLNAAIIDTYELGYAPNAWQILEHVPNFKSHVQNLIQAGMLIQKDNGGQYDRYRHRLMFPIRNKLGQIIGFGGRSLDNTQKPKYLNSPETPFFHKNRELYGLYQVLKQHQKPDYILIVEGYMDVIALAQMGITQAVATLGTATNAFHIQVLAQYTEHIIFCFDGDEAGLQAAQRGLENVLPLLNTAVNISFIFLPNESDPDSFIRTFGLQAFQTKIKEAISWQTFLLQSLLKNADLSTPAGKNKFLHTLLPFLQKIPDCPHKSLLLSEVSRLTHVDSHAIAHLQKSRVGLQTQSAVPLKMTPLRIAIARLLQHPELYISLSHTYTPEKFESNEYKMLAILMNKILADPSISTAHLIESFRTHTAFEQLNQLAIWEHLAPLKNIQQELEDTLKFLTKKESEKKIQQFIQQAKIQPLTPEERQTLQQLLQESIK